MEVDVRALLEIIGELEVSRRFQKSEIERLEEKLSKKQSPTPIKSEADSDAG